MNRVQPPARDYVPRRSGELAASLLQAYAIFPHNIYDAGGTCFVPSNVIFDAKNAAEVTYESDEWKSRYSLPIRLGRVFAGCAPTCGFFARAQPSLHFGLQIFAKAFGNDARSRQFPQVGNRKLRKIGENRSERGGGVADQGEPNVVIDGPLVMMNDGRNH